MMMFLNRLLNFVFPNLCVVCNERLSDGEKHICILCLSQLPKTNYHLQPDNMLEHSFAGRFPFERIAAYAYFMKDGSMQKMVHELKYNNNPKIGHYLGRLYGEDLKKNDFIGTIDYLAPVPLHPKRQRTRGYNQSLEIAKGLADSLNINVESENLKRIVNNPSQTKNSRIERWKNVEDIFTIANPLQFSHKHVLLIDDVITTGSTIEACAKELLKCEGTKISVLSIAVAI